MNPLEQEVLENISNGVYFLDTERRITYWNRACEHITGFAREEVIGKPCSANILKHVDQHGKNMCESSVCPVAQCMKHGSAREASVFLHHKNGHRVPVAVRANPLKDDKGQTTGAIEIFKENYDVYSLRARIEDLEKKSLLDSLTQIGNRDFGNQHLHEVMHQAEATQMPFAVLMIDIDHFKNINDIYGHNVGDKVLKMAAQTLLHNVQPFDYVARWGGEEFLVIYPNINSERLWLDAEKLRHLVATSDFEHKDELISTTISIGATGYIEGDTIESILFRADAQLYKSKESGRNCVTLSYGETELTSRQGERLG